MTRMQKFGIDELANTRSGCGRWAHGSGQCFKEIDKCVHRVRGAFSCASGKLERKKNIKTKKSLVAATRDEISDA